MRVLVKNIEMYCKAYGTNEAQFEKTCHLGKGLICNWKKGAVKSPTLDTLMKIEAGTGIPIARWLKEGSFDNAVKKAEAATN